MPKPCVRSGKRPVSLAIASVRRLAHGHERILGARDGGADDASEVARRERENFDIVYGICAGAPSGPQRMSGVTREPARDVPEGDEEAQGVARLCLMRIEQR